MRYTVLAVAAYQIIAGAVTLALVAETIIRDVAIPAGFAVLAGFAALLVFSGMMLFWRPSRWVKFAAGLQLAQALHISTSTVAYYMTLGLNTGPAVVFSPGNFGILFRSYWMASFHFSLTRPVAESVVGLNLVAVGAVAALLHQNKARALSVAQEPADGQNRPSEATR